VPEISVMKLHLEGKEKYIRKACLRAHFFTKNPIQNGLGSNL